MSRHVLATCLIHSVQLAVSSSPTSLGRALANNVVFTAEFAQNHSKPLNLKPFFYQFLSQNKKGVMAHTIDPTSKADTLRHMNDDHTRDMALILAHYLSKTDPSSSKTKPFDLLNKYASSIKMTEINLDFLVLCVGEEEACYRIPFEPPLSSWNERRSRLVALVRAAREGLGVSEEEFPGGSDKTTTQGMVTVDEYMPPRFPIDMTILFLVVGYYAIYALLRAGWFEESELGKTVVSSVIAPFFPGGWDGFRWLTETIFIPVVGIHTAEAWWLDRTRLSRYGVKRGSLVWLLWIASALAEGRMTFVRFDTVVERKRRAVGKKE